MAFEYRLEVLLKLQKSLEHQEENRLLACAGRVVRLKVEIENLRTSRIERRRREIVEMESGVAGIMLQMAMERDESLKMLVTAMGKQLEVAEQARLEQMIVYRAARQKREVLQGLKERLETIYDQNQLRRIQQGLDDSYLMRKFVWKES